jgi:uncharacterized membrane protein YjdF
MPQFLTGFVREHRLLSAFSLLYVLAFSAWSFAGGNSEFVFYSIVMVIAILGVLYMHTRVRFSTTALWLLSIWGLLHMAGGNVRIPASLALDWAAEHPEGTRTVLYNLRPAAWLPKFDQFVHAFGFFTATLASFEAIRAAADHRIRIGVGTLSAALLCGMGLGAINEVVEFAATRVMTTNVGGYENTGWDLVSNLTGCVLAVLLIALTGGRLDPPPEPAA